MSIQTIGGTQPRAGGRRPAGFIIADGPTTGLVYSADGLILSSAFNFIRDPSVITVALPDGRRLSAELLARDEMRQLALLKIAATGLPTPQWSEDSRLRVGQWVIAFGRGFDSPEPSLTVGIISGLNRQSGLAVQTDAKLSPANYGGPVVDLDGRVIGIAVPVGLGGDALAGVELYDSGIGFVIPASEVAASAKALAVGHSLRRGMLGVRIEDARRVATAPHGGGDEAMRQGPRIAGVGQPSPAERAGLQVDDVIIAIDGQHIWDYPEMQRLLRRRLAGERITVRVRRDKEELDLRVVLAVPEDIGKIPDATTTPAAEPGKPQAK